MVFFVFKENKLLKNSPSYHYALYLVDDLESARDGDRRSRLDEPGADAFRHRDDCGGPGRWREREEETNDRNANDLGLM